MKYDYADAILEGIMDGTMEMRHEIVMIPTEKIYPHPDNPRKDLGDLSELADSILANGVLQNLTVVPWETVHDEPAPCEGAVVTVIGHRRRAAAEQAGVRELPCIITKMDKAEQVGTMLLENMQRAELTVLEQAQGFQMMMDLGSTVEEIADLTGFAPRTVQRRLQIAKLPAEAFEPKKMAEMRIEDYVKVAQIEDPEVQKKIIAYYVGTSSFDWQVRSALEQQQIKKDMAQVKPLLAAAGYKKFSGSGNPHFSGSYEVIWEAKPADIAAAGALPYTNKKVKNGQWYVYNDRVALFDDAKKKVEKVSPKRMEADRKRKELKTLCEKAQQSRYDFIRAYKPKREHEKIVNRWYLEMSIREISQNRGSPEYGLMWDAVQKNPTSKWYRPDETDLMRVIDENGKLAYITWVLTGDRADVLPYEPNYMEKAPEWIEGKSGLKTWERAYGFLQALGYPVSDEERSLMDGTHELYGD